MTRSGDEWRADYNQADDLSDLSPRDLMRLYSGELEIGGRRRRLYGALYRPEETERLLAGSRHPLFSVSGRNCEGTSDGRAVVLYPHVLKFDPDAYATAQKTGDCVSHGTRNACDLTRAAEIVVKGEPEGFYVKGATEAIYGSRGHGGQGMSCAGAARFVTETGGLLLRKDYTAECGVDLSDYAGSYQLGMGWGRRGVPDEVLAEARKHQVGAATLIQSTQEAADAIANGYGIAVCSSYGFSSSRDENGVAGRKGSWSHCMCCSGVDDTEATRRKAGSRIFCIQNSWGKWNDGPKHLGQPDGSFWILEKVFAGMIDAGGTFAFSNVDGFPPQKLPDAGFTYLN